MVKAQCTNGNQPECACETAPVLCTIDELDGYTFSMTSFQHPNDGPTPICPNAFTTQTNNPTWFAFTAWCTNLSLRVHSTNCHQSGGAIGFQLAIYTNCNFNHVVACNADANDCNTNDKILNLTGLNIGAVYYFMVDGCLGSYCTVTIDIIGVCGQEHIAPWTEPVIGNINPCAGNSETYTVEHPDGARFYHWFVDGVLLAQTTTDSFKILWPNPGTYQLCIDVSNDPCVTISDPPLPLCTTITVHTADAGVLNVTPAILCRGDDVNIISTGFTGGPENTQIILVTDALGVIIAVINGSAGTFSTFGTSGSLIVYAYNYLTATGTIPVIGDLINDLNCTSACCDLESQTVTFQHIEAVVSGIACNNNGTGNDSTDDTFTFSVLVTGLSPGTLWLSTDGTLDGIYGTPKNCGPYLISGGTKNFNLHDYNVPTCWTSIIVDPPVACSSCPQIIDAGTGSVLNCINTRTTLTGVSSETGAYLWTGPNLFSSDSLVCIVSDSGWYYLNIDFTNQCSFTDSVFVDLIHDAPIANAGTDQLIDCHHAEVMIDGSGSTGDHLQFAWSNIIGQVISTQTFVLVDTAGIYYLQLTNSITGCISIDSAQVFINQNALGDVIVTVIDENCEGENNGMIEVSDILGGIPPYSYSIDSLMDNSTGQFDSLASGGYNLHITDAFGCALDTFLVIHPGIHLELTLPEVVQLHEEQTGLIQATVNVPIGDLSSVQWSPAGILSCDTCLTTIVMTNKNQSLQLIVVHVNGCVDTAELNITVFPTPKIYIPNTFSPNGDGINDFFALYSNNGVESILEINIFDRWGEHIYQAKNLNPNIPELGWDGKFHHQEMLPGTFVYYFKLLMVDGTQKTMTGDVTLVR
ncbi:MAG: gliding motility-associated C-terminal domain-containing protein [Saprospiraceae bacterium]